MRGRTARLIYSLLMSVVILGCNKNEESGVSQPKAPTQSIIQSPIDKRLYRPLLLENGLKILLVSDADTSKAAVSMNVDVGSGGDPDGREGLAHFVEHMLFLGTKKYPEADAYQSFISSQGGQHNAYTAFEDTNYFFDVNAEALLPALDRFAQFFTAPLFSEAYLERERLAVSSEYKARIQNEFRRYIDALKTQVNPKHPFKKFSVGSDQTLRVDGLAEAVKAFYKQHYHADNMSLVVSGAQSLNELEASVVRLFEHIPVGTRSNIAISEPIFKAVNLPALLYVKPLKDSRNVSVAFPMPDMTAHNLHKPLMLIGHLLGHEGQGSLFQYLKQRGWAESLSAGNFLDYHGGALFTVSVNLTETGANYTDEIVANIFAAIRELKKNGLEAWRYEELASVNDLQFAYQAKPEIMAYTRNLAASLRDFPEAYWLKGAYEMAGFNQSLLASLIDEMIPSNAFISKTTPDVVTDKISPWYMTEYAVAQISGEQLTLWRNNRLPKAVYLPVANPYIPDTTHVATDEQEKPHLISQDEGVRVWHQQVTKYQEPRGMINVSLYKDQADIKVEQTVVYAIAAKLLNDQVNQKTYEAKTTGYGVGISVGAFGIDFDVYGYDQKLPLLLDEVISAIKSIQWDQAQFIQARDELSRHWKNYEREPPYKQLMNIQKTELIHPYWGKRALWQVADTLSFSDFIKRWQQQAQFTYAEALLLGNIDQDQAAQLNKALQVLAPKEPQGEKPQRVVRHLTMGSQSKKVDLLSEDAGVLVYIQSPTRGLKARAMTALTSQLLESSFFHQLRTEQQLGYIVFMSNRLLDDVPGLMMLVQSPSHSSNQIIAAIAHYWANVLLGETAITEADFEQHKASLRLALLKPKNNVAQLAQKQWRDIDRGFVDFDQIEQLVEALDTVSYEQWLQFIHTLWDADKSARVIYSSK